MPSFTRRIPSSAQPAAPSAPLSTGLPSLDDLLGGGLPLHSVLLVLAPDTQSAWGRLVERYFIAQGLSTGQSALIAGQKDECEAVVKGCMWTEPGAAGDGSESEGEGVEGGGGNIAWRYDKMARFKTTVGNGSNLSLMTPIPAEVLDHVYDSGRMSLVPIDPDAPSTSHGGVLNQALKSVCDQLQKAGNDKVTRVVIHELGNLDWGNTTTTEINRFLHSLRSLLKTKLASALVTIPSSFLVNLGQERETVVETLAWGVNGCVELKGFADDPTLPPLFPTHGLLTLHSYPTTSTLLPPTLKNSTLLGVSQSSTSSSSSGGGGGAGENNLGFRLKRKRFVVETVHLGVEGGVGERRVGGDVGEAVRGADPTHSHTHTLPPPAPTILGGVEPASTPSRPTPPHQSITTTIDDKPRGADSDTNKRLSKPRARVRFGGEEDMVSVSRADDPPSHGHGHGHVHQHGEGCGHEHGKAKKSAAAPKVMMRHDRPDLYEF